MKCAECGEKNCKERGGECTADREDYIRRYQEEDREMITKCYEVISEGKSQLNRIEEIILFAQKMGYKKLGVAFCKGLAKQGKKLCELLSKDFEVVSVCCKIDEIDKSEISVSRMNPDCNEVACNPLAQADMINKENVDLTIMCGFCLGHDILFLNHIKGPVTPLVVKDRVLKHKSVEALE